MDSEFSYPSLESPRPGSVRQQRRCKRQRQQQPQQNVREGCCRRIRGGRRAPACALRGRARRAGGAFFGSWDMRGRRAILRGREERRFLASVSDIGVLTFSSFPRAGVAAVAAGTAAAAARIFSPERTPAGAASSERGC